jgi:hypothetical protein
MDFEILGHITCQETGATVHNLRIEAFGLSELTNKEKKLGTTITNEKGDFHILFPNELLVGNSDHYVIRQWGIYLMIFNQDHVCVYDGRPTTEFKPKTPLMMEIRLPEGKIKQSGTSPQDRMAEMMKFAHSRK